MSKKGMKLTGILQSHNQHPDADQKYQPLRTNIRNSKQKHIPTQFSNVSQVSRKLRSLSRQQAELIKNTAYIPVNCGLRVTSNEEKQHQALQRQYVAINVYEKEGLKPITPNTFAQLPKNQKYEVVYEYHCPNSDCQEIEYYNSEAMTQNRRVTGERLNYQLNENGAVRNSISPAGQQPAVIRNTISPSSNQVIRNNVSPSGQNLQSKVTSQKIYGPAEGKPIQGVVLSNNTRNNAITGSTIKTQSVIDYEVKSRINSPDSNIKGSKAAVTGSTPTVKEPSSAVKGEISGAHQQRMSFEGERRTDVISGSKGKQTPNVQTIYGPRQGQAIKGSTANYGNVQDISRSTIKDRTLIYDNRSSQVDQTNQRKSQYQEQYRGRIQYPGGAQYEGSNEYRGSTERISLSPIKVTTQTQEINRGRADSSGNNGQISQVNTKSNEVANPTNLSIEQNVSKQQTRKNTVSKQAIYGPVQGQAIDGTGRRQASLESRDGLESSLISSKVANYDQSAFKANQVIGTNTSLAMRGIQQTNTNDQQTKRPTNSIHQINSNQPAQGIVSYETEYRGETTNISMQPIDVMTKTQKIQQKNGNNGSSVNLVRQSSNPQDISNNNRGNSQAIQQNASIKQIKESNVSRQSIYGPQSGQPVNGVIYTHHGSMSGGDSTIISSSKHVANYGPATTAINQGIRTNTSPSSKLVREGTSPNRGTHQQANIYTQEEYRIGGGSNQMIANDDNAFLSGPAFFETEGRTKYNQTGRNSRNDYEAGSKKQITSGGTGGIGAIGTIGAIGAIGATGTTYTPGTTVGNIEIGGRNKAKTRQSFDDSESNIGINSRHNQKNMGSTREYSRKEASKQDMLDRQETEVKGEYQIGRQGHGDMESSKHREYVQNVQSRIIIGGGNGDGRSQEEIVMRGQKKVQTSKEQAQYELKAERQKSQYTKGQQNQSLNYQQAEQPLHVNISTRPALDPSSYSSPQLEQRKKKLSEYQQTGTKGYSFNKSSQENEPKRKKEEYKYNLYSMMDEQFNLKCATGLCVPNEICASSPKREGWN